MREGCIYLWRHENHGRTYRLKENVHWTLHSNHISYDDWKREQLVHNNAMSMALAGSVGIITITTIITLKLWNQSLWWLNALKSCVTYMIYWLGKGCRLTLKIVIHNTNEETNSEHELMSPSSIRFTCRGAPSLVVLLLGSPWQWFISHGLPWQSVLLPPWYQHWDTVTLRLN